MSELSAQPADIALGDLAALHTATPAELRTARVRQVFGPPRLRRPAEWFRTLARSTALSAFLFASVAFACYPRPWYSHWSPQKRITVEAIELALYVWLVSVVCCAVAHALKPACASAERRPLRTAAWCNAATFLIELLTPAF